ncbi:hypothetical protein TWF696_002936 [Orbilia brochopaga]|uniref:Uncharacterized protein n=1 Tax=Orbilia brochopaga TaxID=3140254 RepID=A0AAV9U146_9PEZI
MSGVGQELHNCRECFNWERKHEVIQFTSGPPWTDVKSTVAERNTVEYGVSAEKFDGAGHSPALAFGFHRLSWNRAIEPCRGAARLETKASSQQLYLSSHLTRLKHMCGM